MGLKEYFEKKKQEWAYEKAANEVIAKKQKEEYFKAKSQEALRVAKMKAKIEADAKIKRMQQAYNPVKVSSYGNPFGGGLFGARQEGKKNEGHYSIIGGGFIAPKTRIVYRYRKKKR